MDYSTVSLRAPYRMLRKFRPRKPSMGALLWHYRWKSTNIATVAVRTYFILHSIDYIYLNGTLYVLVNCYYHQNCCYSIVSLRARVHWLNIIQDTIFTEKWNRQVYIHPPTNEFERHSLHRHIDNPDINLSYPTFPVHMWYAINDIVSVGLAWINYLDYIVILHYMRLAV